MNLLHAPATVFFGLMLILLPATSRGTGNMIPAGMNHHPDVLVVNTPWESYRELYTYDVCNTLLTKMKQYWDSQNWYDSELTTYTYDENGNLLMEFIEYLEYGGAEKFTYTYDGDGNRLTMLYQWTIDYDEWYNVEYILYTYDSKGNMLTLLDQYWSGSGNWESYTYETFSYDKKGNLLVDLTEYLDWDFAERYTYTYNKWGQRLTMLEDYRDGDVWTNSVLVTYEYGPGGNLIHHLAMTWMDEWENMSQAFYTYDGCGNCLSKVSQWYLGMDTWVNSSKCEYEYLPGSITGNGYVWEEGEWQTGSTSLELAIKEKKEKRIFFEGYSYLAEVTYSNEPPKLVAFASPYKTVYYGYPPKACTQVGVIVWGGVPPYTYSWSNGMTTPGFQACPTTSTTYTVTVTDAAGCSVVAHTRVCVIDVRCGNKLDKVLVCHCPPGNPDKCKTLCLTKSEVHSHLLHGDLLGPCGIDHSCTDQKADLIPDLSAISEEDPGIEAYPNPFTHSSVISFPVNETGKVVVCLSNHMGQTVSTVFEGDLEEGDDYQFEINAGDLQPGLYVCSVRLPDGTVLLKKLIVTK